MDDHELYDPPPSYRGGGPQRGRSASFSSAPASTTQRQVASRRQSFSAGSSRLPFEQASSNRTSFDGALPPPSACLAGPTKQARFDAVRDRSLWRDGRQSKQQMLDDQPQLKMTGDFENFMAQVWRGGLASVATDRLMSLLARSSSI